MQSLTLLLREMTDHYNHFVQKTRHRMVKKLTESALQNLDLIHAIEGAKSSARFEKAHLRGTSFFKTRRQLFEQCLNEVVHPDGFYLEFGTYKGNSINLLAKLRPNKHFYGFDSFEGLPETWTQGCRKGAFSLKGALPVVRDNVSLIKGFFEESLSPFIEQYKNQKIAFLHIDCDLYSSTKTVLTLLSPMIHPGTVICFDEYYNYPEWEEGEYKAFIEYCETFQRKFEYLGYIRIGSQVAVKMLS